MMNRLLVLASTLTGVAALNNGLGLTPAMGYSSWNDCSSMRDNGPDGWCWNTEEHIKNTTLYFISSGLAKLGYTQINIDEGWLKGRAANGSMVEDWEKFPSGMKGLGDWIKSQETFPGSGKKMRYGLYSCRGTCQCGTHTYSAPGSHGFEKADVDWMVTHAGADYLKIDSCCGDQDHATAFSDYAKFRDAMNATGQYVYFSLCGWHEWYSPPDPSINYTGGYSLGNSWRIAGDGSGWGPLTNCINTQAAAADYIGPGGWADPDLLIGPKVYVGGQTDEQARAQFTLWSIFPTNLLISQNVLQWSDYALETYSNDELIAINQDPLGKAAKRIVGDDLDFPCKDEPSGAVASVQAVACDTTDPTQQWKIDADSNTIASVAYPGAVLDDVNCAADDGSPVALYTPDNGKGTCNGQNQLWQHHASDGTITSTANGKCLDVFQWVGPAVDVWACNGGPNQNWTVTASGQLKTQASEHGPAMCLAARQASNACTNVWGRQLSQGEFALGLLNNGNDAANVTCDTDCFDKLNISSTVKSLTVRDLWAHRDVATIAKPFAWSAMVNGSGFANAYKLTPA
eukprot:m.50314 g.50314  ORF g.50314 m.50314 type:complete len:571 (+) comp7229_c0_seq2:61-1773(+)